MSYSVPLELTKYLTNEADYLPWHRVISSVTYIADMLEDATDLYPLFQVMKQKYIPAWHYWIWQFSICNGNNIEVQVIFSVAELSGFTFCYCTQKSAESCLVPISELPGSIQVYVLEGKKLCLFILIIHHHKPQYSHLFLKAARHPLNKDVLGNKISDTSSTWRTATSQLVSQKVW